MAVPETTLDARKQAMAVAWELATVALEHLQAGRLNEALAAAEVAGAWAALADVNATLQVANIRTT